jgi:hypothetical protein
MKWWLKKHFSPQRFRVFQTDYVQTAMNFVKRQIDAGFPIMVSTNHDRTAGHIILVIGYRSTPGQVSGGVDFVCHDPFGKFDPQLGSHQYGKRRYEGGMSLSAGSEHGPGRAVVYDHDGIRRIRADKHSSGKFFMISAQT